MLIFKLKKIMDDKNITITELANLTGISRPSISAMYNNQSKSVNLEILSKVSEKLNVKYTDILVEEQSYYTFKFLNTFESDNELCVQIELVNKNKVTPLSLKLTSNFFINSSKEKILRYIYFELLENEQFTEKDLFNLFATTSTKDIVALYKFILKNIYLDESSNYKKQLEIQEYISNGRSKTGAKNSFEVGFLTDPYMGKYVYNFEIRVRTLFGVYFSDTENKNIQNFFVFE